MTDASSKPIEPRRRWFQFSLGTLLIAVTLVTGLLVAWRAYVEPYRRQRETMALIKELGGSFKTEADGPVWIRDWFGADNFQNVVLVDLADCDDPEKYLGQITSLPRLETLVVGGLTFADEHLSRLERLRTLNGLVLDSTTVTGDAIEALKQALPALAIHKSQRQAIVAIKKFSGFASNVSTELCERLPKLRQLVGGEYFMDVTMVICTIGSKYDDEGMKHIKGLTTLQKLHLSSTQVSDAGLVHLIGLTTLQQLSLDSTSVSDAGMVHLTKLSNLQELDLGGTRVTDAGLANLKGLTNLQFLSLRETQVRGAGLAHLKGLTSLQYLDLDFSQVSVVARKELQQALPNCKIYH